MAYADVKGETCLQGVCDNELGGHAWAGIEYWGGMCEQGENRERVCMGWDRIGGGHAWSGIE